MDWDIFLILNFGFGLINFLLILSQYIFNLETPWLVAPTNSALTNASEHIFACGLLNLYFINTLISNFSKFSFFIKTT